MIIDGSLVVSKKKKDVLVAELRKLNFKPFSKALDAKQGGEMEDFVQEDDVEDSVEDATDRGAKDYDYLLGMAIWSLTQERVDKLLRQIGDKEVEIDELIKLTPKDLWNRDLDDFIAEWHFQLDDEKKRAKKRAAVGRRASAKLGLQAKGAKRKRRAGDSDNSDDDFMVSKKKATLKGKQSSILMNYFSNPQPRTTAPSAAVERETKAGATADEDFMDIDDNDGPQIVAVKKRGRPAAATAKSKAASKPAEKVVVKEDLSDVDDVFAAVQKQATSRKASDPPARQARAATKKSKYVLSDSDSEESNGDDDLGDVSMMVKGIGNSSDNSASAGVRPLFSNTAVRPSSGHGLPRSIPKKGITDLAADDSDGIDETDYKSLIPHGSPIRPAPRRARETMALDDDDEFSFDVSPAKPKIISKKSTAPAKAPLAKTKAKQAVAAEPKPVTLSPAAKSYAAKHGKGVASSASAATSKAPAKKTASKKKVVESDEESLANDLLSENDEPVALVSRPGRRAAAAKAKPAKYDFSDDDDEGDEEEEDSFMVDDSE
jgi:DNA topoisomerase II